jgi:hypothetical protein
VRAAPIVLLTESGGLFALTAPRLTELGHSSQETCRPNRWTIRARTGGRSVILAQIHNSGVENVPRGAGELGPRSSVRTSPSAACPRAARAHASLRPLSGFVRNQGLPKQEVNMN